MCRIVGTAAAAPAATATNVNNAPTINQMMPRRMGRMLQQFARADALALSPPAVTSGIGTSSPFGVVTDYFRFCE